MCSYSLLLVNSIFCCELHFLPFSHVCQIYAAGVLSIRFFEVLPSKVFITYENQSEVNFWGVNSRSRSIFVLYLLRVHSIFGSNPIHVSPYMMGVSTPFPVLSISILFALHLYKPYFFFYFLSAILIALNDNLELAVL